MLLTKLKFAAWLTPQNNFVARAYQDALTIHDSSVGLNYDMDRNGYSVAPFGFPQGSKLIHNLARGRTVCGIFVKAAGNHICYLLWAFLRHPAVAHNSAQPQVICWIMHITTILLCIQTQRANDAWPSCYCTLMTMQSLQATSHWLPCSVHKRKRLQMLQKRKRFLTWQVWAAFLLVTRQCTAPRAPHHSCTCLLSQCNQTCPKAPAKWMLSHNQYISTVNILDTLSGAWSVAA